MRERDAAADRRGQWSLDADQIGLERLQSIVGQPGIEALLGFLPRVHLRPGNLLLTREFLGHGRVEHTHRCAPNVGASTVTFDERYDGPVRHLQDTLTVQGDGLAARRDDWLG